MDMDKILEQMRDMILGELKQEFAHFRESVTEELSGFRVAIESISARQSSMENDLREIRKSIDETRSELGARIDETNKRIDEVRTELGARIDEVRSELKVEIMKNTERIDKVNARMDATFFEVSKLRGDLEKALSQKVIMDDLIVRVKRLEGQAA